MNDEHLANLKYYFEPKPAKPKVIETDMCIYGGHSGGVAAAVQAARMGMSVVIAEFGRHLGGLSAGGLGPTYIGNKAAIGGISREFYKRLGGNSITMENTRSRRFKSALSRIPLRAITAI